MIVVMSCNSNSIAITIIVYCIRYTVYTVQLTYCNIDVSQLTTTELSIEVTVKSFFLPLFSCQVKKQTMMQTMMRTIACVYY